MTYATKKEKKTKRRSAFIFFYKGNHIVLNKGKGSKCKYNGWDASILEYPSKGVWMTVATSAGNALKWRKGQWIVKPSEGYNVHNINDDLWCNIFSFLVGSIKTKSDPSDYAGVWVKDAKDFHLEISKVCKRWKNLCNSNMTAIFGHINANLDALLSSQVILHVHWMIKYKVSIGILVFCADYADILFLVKLLDTCDTTRLTVVKARCNTIYICDNTSYIASNNRPIRGSFWISDAYTAKEQREVIDLTSSSYRHMALKDICDLVGVPYSRSPMKLRQLHDAIAYNCKNLSELLINLDIPAETQESDLRDHLSESLFSPDLKCKLHLSLSLPNGIISPVMDIVLEKLVNLELLSISMERPDGSYSRSVKIRLDSKHLQSLDVSQLGQFNFICGNLPNLKSLRYKGGFSGFIPVFLNDEEDQRCIDQTVDFTYHYHASEVRIHSLSIPPECKIIALAKPISKPQWVLDVFSNARIC
jgi:hypothetical protein